MANVSNSYTTMNGYSFGNWTWNITFDYKKYDINALNYIEISKFFGNRFTLSFQNFINNHSYSWKFTQSFIDDLCKKVKYIGFESKPDYIKKIVYSKLKFAEEYKVPVAPELQLAILISYLYLPESIFVNRTVNGVIKKEPTNYVRNINKALNVFKGLICQYIYNEYQLKLALSAVASFNPNNRYGWNALELEYWYLSLDDINVIMRVVRDIQKIRKLDDKGMKKFYNSLMNKCKGKIFTSNEIVHLNDRAVENMKKILVNLS